MKAPKSAPNPPDPMIQSRVRLPRSGALGGGKTRTSPLQAIADASPRVRRGSQLASTASRSPRVALQRKRLERVFGSPEGPTPTPVQRIGSGPARTSTSGGLPENLKNGIESLSGVSMDPVRVHYNSSKPAGLGALAYAQGSDIHVAPGQERHLPHEAWHVVQQAQGRVQATGQLKSGIPLNDDPSLEREADSMGRKAASTRT